MRELEQWAAETRAALLGMEATATEELRAMAERARHQAASRVRVRTGDLQRSISTRVDGSAAEVYSDDPAAAALEEGTEIRGNPWLAIPLRGQQGSPREDGDLFVLRSPRGLFLASAESGQAEIRWKLQASVQPQRQPFLRPAVDEQRDGFAEHLFRAWTEDLVDG